MKSLIVLCGEYGSGKSTLADMLKTSVSQQKTIYNCDIIKYVISILKSMDYNEVEFSMAEETRLRSLLAKHIDKKFLHYNPIHDVVYQEESDSDISETAFALALKKIISALFCIEYNVLLGVGDIRKTRETYVETLYEKTNGMSYRTLIEYIANDVFKPEYGDNIWADILLGRLPNIKANTIIISDLRYECEYNGLLALNGKYNICIFRIERPGLPISSKTIREFNAIVINNYGLPDEMKKQVDVYQKMQRQMIIICF